jgi:hypothetical protein
VLARYLPPHLKSTEAVESGEYQKAIMALSGEHTLTGDDAPFILRYKNIADPYSAECLSDTEVSQTGDFRMVRATISSADRSASLSEGQLLPWMTQGQFPASTLPIPLRDLSARLQLWNFTLDGKIA